MSLSKLESLPNELLTDLIENYINGMDILMAFGYQLNRRFDTLIQQIHRLHFDFTQCRKDAFCFCMGLLPAYMDKIEELTFSEKDTPGQLYAFLSFFPLFSRFKRLRKLHFDYNEDTVPWSMVLVALRSLSSTNIDTLSIKIINIGNASALAEILERIQQITTLKRLSVTSDLFYFHVGVNLKIISNIEYLNLSGMCCQLMDLEKIFQWIPSLRYLNVRIKNSTRAYHNQSNKNTEQNIIPIPLLRTLILSFEAEDSTTLDMLAPYLKSMSSLTRLKIKASRNLIDADAWETLLDASLPSLSYFTLQTTVARVQRTDIESILRSFQNSFWIEKKNFSFILTDHERVSIDLEERIMLRNAPPFDSDGPVVRVWIAPIRCTDDGLLRINDIASFTLSNTDNGLSTRYYMSNIKCLTLIDMDSSVFEWMRKYINCTRIIELTINSRLSKTHEFASILTYFPNINSLRANYEILMPMKAAVINQKYNIKRLDLSGGLHPFNEKDIIFISMLLPYLEHIHINTSNLSNVSILKTYLPHLRSLTFNISVPSFDILDSYARPRWLADLRKTTTFLFAYEDSFMTVWLDQAAYEDPYWKRFSMTSSSSSSQSTATSVRTTSSNNTTSTKNKFFSFFKFFK